MTNNATMNEGKDKMGNNVKYIDEWKKKNVKSIKFYINKDKEKDILEHLEKQQNKRAYLIDLIRKDMENEV